MSSRASRALVWMVVAVCLGLGAAAPVSAQIYAIRDENGVLTLSDKPLGEGSQTYAVRGASSTVRARGLKADSTWMTARTRSGRIPCSRARKSMTSSHWLLRTPSPLPRGARVRPDLRDS